MRSNLRKEINNAKTLAVVAFGSISSNYIANGKNVPVLIVDTTDNKEIEEAILLHKGINRGKVITVWGRSINGKIITLNINLIEPSPTEFKIIFNIERNYSIIDFIISSQLVYIQPGKPGDRLKTTMSAPMIQIEVPSSHFYDEWYKLYEKNLSKHFRRRKGMSKKVAKQAAIDLYKEIGKLRDFRMK